MENTKIQIRNSLTTPVPPDGSLLVGEPAYSYNTDKLFLGNTTGSGIITVGGRFYVDQQNTIFNLTNAAFDHANSVSTGSNTYAQQVGAASNVWANSIGTAGNNYTVSVSASSNNWANTLATAGNNYVVSVGLSSNSWSNTVAIAGNNYSIAIGAASNAWSNTVGSSANNYTVSIGASSNAWTNTVATAGNNYTNSVGIAGNNYAVSIGASSNLWANAVGTAGNNYSLSIGLAGNNYSISVGAASNTWANTVGNGANGYAVTIGASSNLWANSVGSAGNNYTISVGAASNTWSNTLYSSTLATGNSSANSANAYTITVGNSSNAWTNTVATAGNNYTNTVGASGNSWANTVATAGNNYSISIGASGNSWANTVATAGNNYSVSIGASSNGWTNTQYTNALISANNSANAANNYAAATYYLNTGGTISGDVTVAGNVTIAKSLSVTGNVTFTNTSSLLVSDPLIYLAGNNYTSDVVDIGFVANYVNTTGSNVHTGLYRSYISKEYYLFKGYDKEPDQNFIDYTGNNFTLAVLNADIITSNLTLGGANAITRIENLYPYANGTANSANAYAITVGASSNNWSNTVATAGNNYVVSIGAASNTWANTIGTAGNNYTVSVGASGNSWSNTVATAGNNYSISIGASGNNWANSLATAGNNYTVSVGASSNAYSNLTSAASNSYANIVALASNTWSNTRLANVIAGGPVNITWSSTNSFINATINIATSGVTANTYGGATQIPYFTVDSYGRVTAAANVTVQGMDYAYANAIGNASNTWANNKLANVVAGGPVNITWSKTNNLINATVNIATSGVTANTYGGTTQIPYITVDSYGRITSAANVTVQTGGMDYAYANQIGAASNTWANTKLSNSSITLAGSLTTTGQITSNGYVYITPVGGAEGGEIQLQATGSNTNWSIDSYQNNFRVFTVTGSTVSNVNFFHAGAGSIKMGVNKTDPAYTVDVSGDVNVSGKFRINGAELTTGTTDLTPANNWANTISQNWANTRLANVIAGDPVNIIWTNINGYTNATINISTSGVTANTYGGSTQIPYFTVDSYGRITSAANVTVQTGGMDYAYANTIGAASNTWANTLYTSSLAFANGTANSANNWANNKLANVVASGPVNITWTKTNNLINATINIATSGVTANTYGNATIIPVITVDSYGRVTSAANVTAAGGGSGLANTSGISFIGDLYFPAGNIGVGSSSSSGYRLYVNGSFAANTKSFVIDHPTKSGMKLRYGSLEGPENGVYVRGKIDGTNVIELPDYWEGLVDLDTISVSLTAIGHTQNLYVTAIDGLKIHIDTENHTQPYCYYHVYAERKDVEKLVVEY